MNPTGTVLKPKKVSTNSPTYTSRTTAARRNKRRTAPAYALVAASNPLLNRRKNQPSTRSRPRAIRSFFALLGFSSIAAKAGLKVRELKATFVQLRSGGERARRALHLTLVASLVITIAPDAVA